MADINHSPEPWALFGAGEYGVLFEVRSVGKDKRRIIGFVCGNEDAPVDPEDLANAALIIAAPRLLRSLRRCLAATADSDEIHQATKEADELFVDLRKAGVIA